MDDDKDSTVIVPADMIDAQEAHRGLSIPRTSNAIAENVVVPKHLLSAVNDHDKWFPDPNRRRSSAVRTDPPRLFDVRKASNEQTKQLKSAYGRSSSITVGKLGRDQAGIQFAGPRVTLRKTSLPTVTESRIGSPGWDAQSDGNSESPTLPTPSGPVSHSSTDSNNAVLFQGLGQYSWTGAGGDSALLSHMESFDPLSHAVTIAESEKGQGSNRMSRATTRRLSTMRGRATSVAVVAADTVTSAVQNAAAGIGQMIRRSSLTDLYEKAKIRGKQLQREPRMQIAFEWTVYLIIIAFIYFVLVGLPLWKGAIYWLYWVIRHKFVVRGTWSITIGIAIIYAYIPLLIQFEREPPMPADVEHVDATKTPGVHDTALLIPCYKSAKIIGPTLEAATKIFPPRHIFVVANGNNPTPLDDTEAVCDTYGVNHVWSPVGSKIVAQFVGCYAAKGFKNVLLIDDDCALPPNFPIVSERMTDMIKCIGYTIKSVGPESSKGTLCVQAQDLEYKLSGLNRALAGMIGSATFPHGAISLWDTNFLISTFHEHPGFSVSEDWFFGHVARKLGCRIKMCTAVFVETETPSAIFFSSGGSRGGFGEMTIFKQRFLRWNFFFVNGMYYNMAYIFGSWKLGFWELGAKLFVFQEVYETLLYLLTPFVLPISFVVNPELCGILFAATFGLYLVNVTIFNEIHLRRRNESVGFVAVYLYYMPYKIILTAINVASCYWSLYKYAKYFAKRHPKIVEDEKAVEVVLRLEETPASHLQPSESRGRRMTVTAIQSSLDMDRRPTFQSVRISGENHLMHGASVAIPSRKLSKMEHWRAQKRAPRLEQSSVVDFALQLRPASSDVSISGKSRADLDMEPSQHSSTLSSDSKNIEYRRKTSMARSAV